MELYCPKNAKNTLRTCTRRLLECAVDIFRACAVHDCVLRVMFASACCKVASSVSPGDVRGTNPRCFRSHVAGRFQLSTAVFQLKCAATPTDLVLNQGVMARPAKHGYPVGPWRATVR
jgi:hypothetical protein